MTAVLLAACSWHTIPDIIFRAVSPFAASGEEFLPNDFKTWQQSCGDKICMSMD